MEPKYAMREGQEAADHASRQPFNVPLSRYGSPVANNPAPALGQYSPKRQISNNPLAQFIPNITYWPNGDVVPFWTGECEEDDVECKLWKNVKEETYGNDNVVLPNFREHVWTDPWGLPLKKFNKEYDGQRPVTLNPLVSEENSIESKEEEMGVPQNVAEADAEHVLTDEAIASGMPVAEAKVQAEKIVQDKNILAQIREGEESQSSAMTALAAEEQKEKFASLNQLSEQLAVEQKMSADTLSKVSALRAAMQRLSAGASDEAAPAQAEGAATTEGVPMVDSVGPAGDFSGEVQPEAIEGQQENTDIQVCSSIRSHTKNAIFVQHTLVPSSDQYCLQSSHRVTTTNIASLVICCSIRNKKVHKRLL